MTRENCFTSHIVWTGNTGQGAATYRGYKRSWTIEVPGKPVIECSNDPELGGDPNLMNPEDLLLSALSACHMLWYLHLASQTGIVVVGYSDTPLGIGETAANGAGRFTGVTLRPEITVKAGADLAKADAIHGEIHNYCYIARSVAFPVAVTARFKIA